MTVAPRQEPRGTVTETARLPQGKSRELVGVLLFCFSLLLLIALISYHPDDTSLFHESTDSEGTRNWIGPAGAEVSALAFSLFGLPALLIPFVLLAAGWRRLRKDPPPRVVGRGLGFGLLLLGLPPLVQLVLGQVTWRAVPMDSGGLYGYFVANGMEGRLNFVGALLVLASLMAVGLTLALQSSLEDLLKGAARVGRSRSETLTLTVARRRERREKERSRRRVVAKHLQNAREKRSGRDLVSARVSAARSDEPQPVRVRVRRGEGAFGIRRVDEIAGPDDDLIELDGPAAMPLTRRGARGAPVTTDEVGEKLSRVAGSKLRRREHGPHAVESARAAKEAGAQTSLKLPKTSRTKLPPINLLNLEKTRPTFDEDELVQLGELICQRCAEFGVEGTIEGITPGPVITVFELQPAPGVKVSRIVNLQDDLALALKAESIRIDRIPGRSTLGIEIPNPERATIHLGPMLADPKFKRAKSPLTMAIGQTLHGESYYVDLAKMPHLLVAGATGAGKSVALNAMITSILYKATRDQVQFIFIDPKRIELGTYANIPHLKAEVVVEPKKAANALRWAVSEMERRYRLLAEVHVRSIDFYNQAIADPEVRKRLSLREDDETDYEAENDLSPLPYYVIVIDELADLMMVASSEVETCIARLAQMARAVGIHLIVATQRPSVDVLTGMIKANFPCRIAFATASRHDSRTILDQVGSEKLLGRGDALFMPPGSARIMRLHGAFLSEQETAGLVRWLKKQGKPELDPEVVKGQEDEAGGTGGGGDPDDALYEDAARLVVAEGKGSASFLQRRMRVGFSRAARLIDMMEQDGLLGPSQGSKPREILVKPDYFEEIDSHE